jgi:uncharacterized protein (DUF2252 family)
MTSPKQVQPALATIARTPFQPAYLAKARSLHTVDERAEAGRAMRVVTPREGNAAWAPAPDRADPVDLMLAGESGRIERQLPLRHGRMVASPFAFFRGAAAIMAADLATTASTGYFVQACGDCHLLNFGAFATPERRIIFDINDFDETFPAPWEWDLKRLATSFVVASLANGHRPAEAAAAARAVARSYGEHLAELSTRKALDVWYSYQDWEELIEDTEDAVLRERREEDLEKALEHDSADDFVKLGHFVDGKPRIMDSQPLIYHPDAEEDPEFTEVMTTNLRLYRESLAPDRRVLYDRFELTDVAIKVVGVGSVGTLCAIALLFASEGDPLFLQIKQVSPSVLEPYVGASPFSSDGERVVFGQRLMQAATDVFLGHMVGVAERHFYVRQLRDVKIRPMVEIYTPANMADYARTCGVGLARAHARSGDPAILSGYIGAGRALADAIAAFAVAYADQNERDHAALVEAVRDGRVEAQFEEA